MSLFERLGEKVERVKQEAEAAREETVDAEDRAEAEPDNKTDGESDGETAPDADLEYRCLECDAGFPDERETCPDCGAAAVVFDG
ncbi:hypothetical protein [Halobiforma nitratireducens]|nr:hypothetical protein [Halobiforma nitratireducens]